MVTKVKQGHNALQAVKEFDDARPSFPGEHWMVLAAGVGVWLASRNSRTLLVRPGGLRAACARAARAASGRDGLAKVLRYTPVGRSIRRR